MTMTFLMIAAFLLSQPTRGSAAVAMRHKILHDDLFELESQAQA
jgi:hypothetical protein